MQILISEDNEYTIGLYKAAFESRGHQVTKEILSKNPGQRIIFSSAHPEDTINIAKELKHSIQLVSKPLEPDVVIDAMEGAKR